jgi:nicotinamidase-related amidase
MSPLEGLRAAMSAVDVYYRERGIFQGKFGFGQRPALVVIDMAYGWTDPASAIRELLPAARAKGVPIYYTTSASEGPQFKSAADFSPRFRSWDRRACEIDERVAPQVGEIVLRKEHASAFAGTPLVGHLIGQGVDTLLITGCSTSACVRATATDAKSYQLKPIIIREAVEDRSEIAHEWTLFDIQARFADVVSLGPALAYLRDLSADARRL